MKILIVVYKIGETSAGISNLRIIKELIKQKQDIKIISANYSEELKEYNIYVNPSPVSPVRIYEFIGNLLKFDVTHFIWKVKCMFKIKKTLKNWIPDVIYGRGSPISALDLSCKIAKKYNIPLVSYFSDPIPAPVAWCPKRSQRKKLENTAKFVLRNSTLISFENKEKGQQQQGYYNDFNFLHKCIITPDPIPVNTLQFTELREHKYVNFVYLGSFYGARSPLKLFSAFDKLVSIQHDVKLIIYDTPNSLYNDRKYSLNIGTKIKFVGRTNNVYEALCDADVLVDVDSQEEHQVYMSNKIKDYMMINRICLFITSKDSPSYRLLGKCQSFVYSSLDQEEIFKMLTFCYKNYKKKNIYTERFDIIKKYSVSNIVQNLINNIKINYE